MTHSLHSVNPAQRFLVLTLACLLAGANIAAAEREDGLVAYWSFDEGSGDMAYDYSLNSNHATIYGAAWADGVSGNALTFDGDDYVSAPPIDLDVPYTVSLWFRYTNTFANGILIHRGFASSCYYEPRIPLDTPGSLRAAVSGCGGSGQTHSAIAVSINEWHHVAYVIDVSTQKLFVDGCEINPPGSKTPRSATLYTQIGGAAQHNDGVATSQFIEHATIDEIRIYDRVLSSAEIQAQHEGLVGYWSLDEGNGETAYDYSGAGNHGAVYGASWTEGISGSAVRFDGDDYVGIPQTGLSTYTVSFWFKCTESSASGTLFHRGYSSSCKYEPRITLNAGFLSTAVSGCGGSGSTHSSVPISIGEWHHVAYVVNASAERLFVDGLEILPAGSKIPQRRTLYTQIGGAAYANDGVATLSFIEDTVIDEVRAYSRALSVDEVREVYWSVWPNPQNDTTDGDQSEVSGTSKDPVNTATGNFAHQETDLSIPSRGSPLIFTRFYNSKAAAPGRKAAKAKQTPPEHKTATSQPASTRDGESSRPEVTKDDEPPANKDRKRQATGSSQARAEAKEKSK